MRVLLVEDDTLLGDGLRLGLSQHGFTVDWVKQSAPALHALRAEPFDALILDLGLPDGDGSDLLATYRQEAGDIPVMILTARNAVRDKLRCLDGGADDYVVKPVDIRELAARLRVLMRRNEGRTEPVIRHNGVELDTVSRRATYEGRTVELSKREFTILHALIRRPGRVMSREQLEELVYGWDSDVESNAVQVHLHNIRRKIGPEVIRTVRGFGYVIE